MANRIQLMIPTRLMERGKEISQFMVILFAGIFGIWVGWGFVDLAISLPTSLSSNGAALRVSAGKAARAR